MTMFTTLTGRRPALLLLLVAASLLSFRMIAGPAAGGSGETPPPLSSTVSSDFAANSSTSPEMLPFPMPPPPKRQPGMVDPGYPIPSIGFHVLGARVDDPLWRPEDLRSKKSILLVTWRTGDERIAEMVEGNRDLLRELEDGGVEVVFAAVRRSTTTIAAIAESVQKMKLDALVVIDEGSRFAKAIRSDTMISLTLIDRDGIARVVNAHHLGQEVAPGTTMAAYLRAGLANGTWPTVEKLQRYDPCVELVGRHYIDFTLPDVASSSLTRFSSLVARDRPTVLLIWSNPCPLCGRMLSPLVKWLGEEGKGRISLVAALSLPTDAARIEASGYMKQGGVPFPVLADFQRSLTAPYRVGMTPSVYVIRPDGMIVAAAAGTNADVPRLLESIAPR